MLRTSLARLRAAGLLDGTTLLLLLAAVPLKHVAGLLEAVRLMGSVHGQAFMRYLAALIGAVSDGTRARRDAARAAQACLIPVGTFLNDRRLRRMAEA
ncbi:DUF3817 domain-containing protein [Roseomonas sp. CCTCC AB2023176]|uniref:DUF3817 domain-containing protein n=1 Tax=Roseomonas sp. CCTCC AB2023176 TaxID=3342640 RepID=UPI0035E302B4